MSVELRPMGVACNMNCSYCYQEPMRKAGNIYTNYDIDKMLRKAESTNREFGLFGGEALLIPKIDLEKIWRRGYQLHKKNSIQTNGTLIDDDHIRMFKKYNVTVGISIDGPEELNSLRRIRGKENNEEVTIRSTNKIIENIEKLVKHSIEVGIIITLHKLNGTENNLQKLLQFMRWLGNIGVKGGNIHTLEVDITMPDQEKHVLSQPENAKAFIKIAKFLEENLDLRYSPFSELKRSIEGDDRATNCIWNKCDPFNTQSVYGIEGNGGLSNCSRTNKEGIDWYKSDDTFYERYISLYNTPQELGGCKGCRFFMLCGGSCPGESIDNDFRNKTIHCHTQKSILGYYEQKVKSEGNIPFTERDNFSKLEEIMISSMENGKRLNIYDASILSLKEKGIRIIEVRG